MGATTGRERERGALVVHRARVHPAAIRALAEAELAVLRAWPQAPRCRSGAHIDGPDCRQHADPTTGADHLPVDPTLTPQAGDDAGETIHAVRFEVWAACPTMPAAMGLEDWAAPAG